MKIIFLVLLSLLVSSQAFSQKKGKVDPKDVTIDSLTKASVALTAQVDTLTKTNATLTTDLDSKTKAFDSLYIPLKKKVIKKDFDVNRTSMIIDSLKMTRDSTFAGLKSSSTVLTDSITVLNAEVTKLKATIASMEAAKANKEALVAELKQLKELLDGGMISQAEYDAKKAKLMEKWE